MSHVRFLGGALADAALGADIRTLSTWEAAALVGAFDVTLSFLSGDEAARVEAALDGVISAHNLKSAVAKRVIRSLTIAVGGAVKNGIDGTQLGTDLRALGLDDARATLVSTLFNTHSAALTQVTADLANSAGTLLDADWRFGVTVSTDDVGRVGSTFLQLRVLVEDATAAGGARESFVELSVSQFYTLLSQLEKAQTLMSLSV